MEMVAVAREFAGDTGTRADVLFQLLGDEDCAMPGRGPGLTWASKAPYKSKRLEDSFLKPFEGAG